MKPPAYSATFLKTFKHLENNRQQAAVRTIESLMSCVSESRITYAGLGLKKLGKTYWEIRSSLADRIIFEWAEDQMIFRLIGSHNEVRRFLKSH